MPLFGYVAPYRSQAKSVAWDYLKHFSRPITKSSNEGDLIIELLNGAKIRLFGADNADAMRGLGFDGLYLDEYGDFKLSVWGNVIRPALSDKQGWCVFGGTPKGKNQFWNIYETSKKLPNEWFSLSLPASKSKLLPESELQAAQAQLAEDQYLQEYECSFEAAIIGAIWGTEMRKVSEDGRITRLRTKLRSRRIRLGTWGIPMTRQFGGIKSLRVKSILLIFLLFLVEQSKNLLQKSKKNPTITENTTYRMMQGQGLWQAVGSR
jgi:hypothetical protein